MRTIIVALLALALSACATLQPADQQFILEQAVMRTVDGHPERAPQIRLAVDIVEGVLTPGATRAAILDVADEVIARQGWSVPDQHAAQYVIVRLMPDVQADLPLTEADRDAIFRGIETVRESLTLMGL